MKAPKSLRRPSNWQDFESLCKKLWGEIWQCAEIKKNGRVGQAQNGVDIYGIPKGEKSNFGIQCKGKNEYSNRKFSQEEIDREIEKAKDFKPELKKLYLTTTAEKDAETEEYVRKKHLESIAENGFEIHLFSWEDLVDLIEESPKTFMYYVQSQNYNEFDSIQVSFQDGLGSIELQPIYLKRYLEVKQKIVQPNYNVGLNQLLVNDLMNHEIVMSSKINYSMASFHIQVVNNGHKQIDNFKINLKVEGEIKGLFDTNYITGIHSVIGSKSIEIKNTKSLTVNPSQKELVPEEVYLSDEIFINAFNVQTILKIHWKFISKSYSTNGELIVNWNPLVKTVHESKLEEDPLKVGISEYPITEYIVEENE